MKLPLSLPKMNTDEKEVRKLRNKLTRVISKAGLSWVSYGSIVDYSEYLPGGHETACWIFDKITKKERILFHKKILSEWPVPLLVLVLRHEFLHKSMYRGIKGATNMALINLALDAAINKILFISQPKNMVKLARLLFPEAPAELAAMRLGLTCVINPSITTQERNILDSRLKNIFDGIYLCEKHRTEITQAGNYLKVVEQVTCCDTLDNAYLFNKEIPDPLTLYNKLASLLSSEQKQEVEKMYSWIQSGGRGGSKDDKCKTPMPNGSKGNNAKDIDKEEDNNGNDSSNNVNEKNQDSEQNEQNENKEVETGEPTEETEDPKGIDTDEFGRRILFRGGEDNQRAGDKKTIDNEINAVEKICSESYSCHVNLKAYFEKYVYQKEDPTTQGLNEFIAKWQTEKQIESVINTIYSEIKNRTSIDPLPVNLTRTGFELVVLDVCGPDQIPLYFNEQKQGAKKKICCYFDTSPSMHSFIPYMVSIAEFFDSCEECEIAGGKYNGRYCFSEKVQGIVDWQKFINGEVQGGCGTSFEIVVKHALNRISEDEVDIVVIFTDGLSGVNEETIKNFNDTNKKCYTIYFTDPKNSYYGWNHGRSCEKRNKLDEMHSDLDKLTGDNFTIFCDTTQKDKKVSI